MGLNPNIPFLVDKDRKQSLEYLIQTSQCTMDSLTKIRSFQKSLVTQHVYLKKLMVSILKLEFQEWGQDYAQRVPHLNYQELLSLQWEVLNETD